MPMQREEDSLTRPTVLLVHNTPVQFGNTALATVQKLTVTDAQQLVTADEAASVVTCDGNSTGC
jgi:predicted nucleic acid-binding protein